jgi:hypothetical protein
MLAACCFGFRLPDSVSDVGEPYEQGGDYVAAEEYEKLCGGHDGGRDAGDL